MRRLILIGIVGLAVASGVMFAQKYDQWFVFPAKRIFVTATFVDPDSAKYRNERITRMGWLCGEVNARNQSGGYVGYKRFVSGSSDDVYLEGVGYAGDNPNSTDRVLDWLDRNLKHLKAENKFAAETGITSTATEIKSSIEAKIPNEIFEEKWKAHCAD